jgi:serine/threonine-protein kinase HipA
MSATLIVYLRNQQVGSLWLGDGRRFAFRYDEGWLANEHAVPLSIALPLRPEVFEGDTARPFFSNLLPEAELRKVIARRLGLSEGNDFGLLEEIGGECAGAVSLMPEGTALSKSGEYHPLNDKELNELVRGLPKHPMLAGEAGIRLSLAGVQNKLPVYYDEDEDIVYLPKGNVASLQILKPPIAHVAHTVENEIFCMQLADRMGLSVPPVTLLAKEQPLYLVLRYDRDVSADREITRLHQEDFCQALSITPDMKYEKEGGPSLHACFELIRRVSVTPIADIKSMLSWVVFNYLIGNADAHGKNISLLFEEHGPKLAPFYDLMCTAVYEGLTQKLAMKIGGEDRPEWITTRRWEQFSKDVGVKYNIVRQTLEVMSKKIGGEANTLKGDFVYQYGACEIIDKIITVIEQRSDKVARTLAAAE